MLHTGTQTRNNSPLSLARKLGIKNLIELPDVMDVKILLNMLGKALE